MFTFTEANFENSIIELFENLGYSHLYGPEVDRDTSNPLLEEQLMSSLETINPKLPSRAMLADESGCTAAYYSCGEGK